MNKQEVTFAVQTEDGIVTAIGKSTVVTPEIKFGGGEIKWFDDTKLLKCKGEVPDGQFRTVI